MYTLNYIKIPLATLFTLISKYLVLNKVGIILRTTAIALQETYCNYISDQKAIIIGLCNSDTTIFNIITRSYTWQQERFNIRRLNLTGDEPRHRQQQK